MKNLFLSSVMFLALSAQAQTKSIFAGSDTLAGSMTDAIIAAGLDQQIQYIGGGSGNAEKAFLAGDQAIGPMSREMKPEVLAQLQSKGISVIGHILALDGISMFVKHDSGINNMDVPTIVRLYTCEFTKWEQVPNSGMKGDVKVYRRNDTSGTTDAFKHFTGLKKFGDCVKVLSETADIAEVTSRDPQAIGYAGLSGKTAENKSLALAAKPGMASVLPTTQTIRDFSYPFARNLYLYELTGAISVNEAEAQLLNSVLDRSFMDPIMQAHEFITID